MIFEEFGLAKQLNQILASHGININNSFEEFLNIAEIPAEAVEEVRDCLIKNECMNVYPEDFPIVDGYEYAFAGEKKNSLLKLKIIMIMLLCMIKPITFPIITLWNHTKTINEQHTYLYKTHYDEWYQLYSLDTSDKCWVLKKSLKMNWITYHSPHMKK